MGGRGYRPRPRAGDASPPPGGLPAARLRSADARGRHDAREHDPAGRLHRVGERPRRGIGRPGLRRPAVQHRLRLRRPLRGRQDRRAVPRLDVRLDRRLHAGARALGLDVHPHRRRVRGGDAGPPEEAGTRGQAALPQLDRVALQLRPALQGEVQPQPRPPLLRRGVRGAEPQVGQAAGRPRAQPALHLPLRPGRRALGADDDVQGRADQPQGQAARRHVGAEGLGRELRARRGLARAAAAGPGRGRRLRRGLRHLVPEPAVRQLQGARGLAPLPAARSAAWSGSSPRARTAATSCSTPSPAAAPRSPWPTSSAAAGSAASCRPTTARKPSNASPATRPSDTHPRKNTGGVRRQDPGCLGCHDPSRS